MSSQSIDVSCRADATPDRVWRLVADGSTWPSWSGHSAFELEQTDAAGGEGVGAIRALSVRRITSRERIVELVPGRRLVYELLSGLPLRDYRAEVDVESSGEGTAIRWRATFRPRVPCTGWFCRMVLRRFLGRAATGLARRAEADSR